MWDYGQHCYHCKLRGRYANKRCMIDRGTKSIYYGDEYKENYVMH